ncbi:MAG: DegT/DnrJ/EryC1/StrS family aminotransferase [Nitrosopumilaceae archaeon]
MKVPLARIDIDDKVKKAAISALESGHFILGKNVEEFEDRFAKFCNTKYGACVGSGTAALFLTLKSLGVKKGDEVMIPSQSFIATATAVLMVGAKVRFVEIDKRNYTLDPSKIQEKISKKTKGIIPVHLYGHPANMNKIQKIAKENSLFVLEDAAQAHGAKYNDKMIGSFGDAACFSFYPSKNLTVCGDGGIVLSNNQEMIKNVKILRNHGRSDKYYHHVLGFNLRFNEIQAAIGKVMLSKLNKGNRSRQKLAKYYNKNLTKQIVKPVEESWATHVYHMYTIRTPRRDELKSFLTKNGIGTGIHYPIPIHKQPIFSKYSKQDLPFTEEVSRTTLSLPMFPSMTKSQAQYVVSKVNKFFDEK